MLTKSTSSLALGLVSALLRANGALAHAPPEVLQVLSHAPRDIVLATTRGFVFGELARRRWTLLCTEAFEVSAGSKYQVARTASGRLLVGDQLGLRYSDDRRCTWQRHPELGSWMVGGVSQHPEHPGHDGQRPRVLQESGTRCS